jgi:hypothetical protein
MTKESLELQPEAIEELSFKGQIYSIRRIFFIFVSLHLSSQKSNSTGGTLMEDKS